jgi:hypothetical protein
MTTKTGRPVSVPALPVRVLVKVRWMRTTSSSGIFQAAAADIGFDLADGAVGVRYDFGRGSVRLRHGGLLRLRLAERIALVA